VRGTLRDLLWPRVSGPQALELARTECERRGLDWEEPVRVRRRLLIYEVWTASERTGGNLVVEVDARSGRVRRVRSLRR
jgi:hypothetical protein